ncbi:anthrone oxygenase family protein [Nocardia sp. R16R-3T]
MPALNRTDDRPMIDLMQKINVVIINPWFMIGFLGTVGFTFLAGAPHLGNEHHTTLIWLGIALALNVIAFAVTSGLNVPLNDQLAAAGDPSRIGDLARVRADFESGWVRWNVLRTILHTLALLVLTGAVFVAVSSTAARAPRGFCWCTAGFIRFAGAGRRLADRRSAVPDAEHGPAVRIRALRSTADGRAFPGVETNRNTPPSARWDVNTDSDKADRDLADERRGVPGWPFGPKGGGWPGRTGLARYQYGRWGGCGGLRRPARRRVPLSVKRRRTRLPGSGRFAVYGLYRAAELPSCRATRPACGTRKASAFPASPAPKSGPVSTRSSFPTAPASCPVRMRRISWCRTAALRTFPNSRAETARVVLNVLDPAHARGVPCEFVPPFTG